MAEEKNKKTTSSKKKKTKGKSPVAKKPADKKGNDKQKNGYVPALKTYYKDVIIGNLTKKFNYSNVM